MIPHLDAMLHQETTGRRASEVARQLLERVVCIREMAANLPAQVVRFARSQNCTKEVALCEWFAILSEDWLVGRKLSTSLASFFAFRSIIAGTKKVTSRF